MLTNKTSTTTNQQNKIDFDDLFSKIDVLSFAESNFPPPAKKEAKNWLYDCPFCSGEQKLSLSIPGYKNIRGFWKCYKCEEKGNLYTFLTKIMQQEKAAALKILHEAAGVPWEDKGNSKGKRGRGRPRKGSGSGDNGGDGDGDGEYPGLKKGKQSNKTSWDRNKGPLPVAPLSSQKIYQRLVELAHLTPEHREETKKNRGFSDKTIDAMQLRSGGDYIAGVLEQLKTEFTPEELTLSGVMVKQNNTLIPCEQLLDNRILIPYLDENGHVYHLRPHKLGFKDVAPQPFCRYFLRGHHESIILTEGEFKAVALAAEWGIPAISVPGISSFSGKYFERLTGLLTEFGVRQVVVIFDNEEKGDPALPNFKQRTEDRYDTPFWAYILGYKLGKEGFQTTIGNLPDEWRENGKIDFDGALAQGRTKQDIEKVIQTAVPPKEFLDSLTDEAQQIVRRKVARFFKKFSIRRNFNKYDAIRFKGNETYEETISNFVINIKSNYYTSDGVIRNIELVNEFGETSESFTLEPGDMAGGDSFKKFCFAKGNYIFKGSSQDLINIWELEFARDTGTVIHVPEKIGRIKANLWLFGNMAIKDGKVYRPGEDGVIWVDGEGYKPQSLHLSPKDEPIEDAIPSLYEGEIDIANIADRMKKCVGGYEAYVGIGWVVMTIFSSDIFRKYKCLPFLFPTGKRESGKSSFMRWIIRFFGIESDGISLSETTQNYIMRALGYFSSLGVWFDEYRNEPQVTKKDGYLRSAYNRQLSGKGIKNTFGARGYDVAGTIAVSGEEVPKDSGLFTRSCFIQMSSNKRDRRYFDDLNAEAEKFSGFVYHLILNYEKYRDAIIENIQELKRLLVGLRISDRTAENWAILAGCFLTTVKEDGHFVAWIKKTCQDLKMSGENDHALNVFWDDINYLVSANEIIPNNFMEYKENEKILKFWYKGLYDAWAIHYRKKTGKEPFDWKSVSNYLRDEPYFMDMKTSKINNAHKHCYFIDVEKATETIKEIASYLETYRQIEHKNGI